METIGSRIIKLRKIKQLTQSQLAEKLKISEKVISNWECGATTPSLEDITAIKSYFNVSLNYLVDGTITDDDKIALTPNVAVAELKVNWIKKCLKFINNANLKKYTDIIFPQNEREEFLSEDIKYPSPFSNIAMFSAGVFIPGAIEYDEFGIPEISIAIHFNKLLALDNYQLYDELTKYKFPIMENNPSVKNAFQKRELFAPICAKDIFGLTDVRFYEKLSNQQEVQNALDDIDKQNPNIWHIIKILIEKGAYIKRLSSVSDPYGNLKNNYTEDWLMTELVYQLALTKIKNN